MTSQWRSGTGLPIGGGSKNARRLCRSVSLLKDWWTWSGSNRRPLPCHFSSSTVAERQQQNVSDNKGAVFMLVRSMSLPLTYARATSLDNARFGQGCEGYDTTHDTKFHGLARRGHRPSRLRCSQGPSSVVRQRRRRSMESPFHRFAPLPNLYFFRADRQPGPCRTVR